MIPFNSQENIKSYNKASHWSLQQTVFKKIFKDSKNVKNKKLALSIIESFLNFLPTYQQCPY